MEKKKKAVIMVRVDSAVHEALAGIAKEENRSLEGQARHVVQEFVKKAGK